MILLSLNLRGVGGTQKSASFRHVLDTTHQNIVFLQETLVHEQKAPSFMNKFRPSWVSCVVSLVGTTGSLLVLWDPYLFNPVPYLTCGGILLTG